MAEQIKLYTMEPMIEAIFNAASPAGVTGFEKEHMLDGNPDTYYKPSTTSQPTFDFDLLEAKTIDAVGFWIQNNESSFASGSGNHIAHQFRESTDDITYNAAMSTANINNVAGLPIYITDISAFTRRYWRLNLTYPSGTPATYLNMAWIFLLKEHDLGQGDEYPVNDSFNYHGKLIKGAGGRGFSKAINSSKQTTYRRSFNFNNDANHTQLQNAIEASQNNLLPMILNLDGVNVDAVRLVGDFPIANTDHNQFKPSLTFESIPFIPDGAVL